MAFQSILFLNPADRPPDDSIQQPGFFIDLNLDQVVDAITAGRQEYNLKPFYYTPLASLEAILYRQEVARDLEDRALLDSIDAFAGKMIIMRRYLAMITKLYYPRHKTGWFIEAAEAYCEAVAGLAHDLGQADLKSPGLLGFREFLSNYVASIQFNLLASETKKLKGELSDIRYCVLIHESRVKVRKYDDEIDYSAEVLKTFEKFKQGAVKDYTVKLAIATGMNHVEAQILDCVAKLFPRVFSELEQYCARHQAFLDPTMAAFDREIQFYVAYREHINRFKRQGLRFCYPQVSSDSKEISNYGGFDLALAGKCLRDGASIVCNDFYLQGRERIIVVSGPNQGGKTTFARAFGQIHYLAGLGCPVPGEQARLFLFDHLLTHFEVEEDIQNLRGKLLDDLVRISGILDQASPNSIVIMNEIFTSTTLEDAIFLSKNIIEKIIQMDALCVCVTFIDELSTLSEKTISMVSTVVPDNPAVRTFKVIRKPADGLSYALSIAEKHRLTYACIKERMAS